MKTIRGLQVHDKLWIPEYSEYTEVKELGYEDGIYYISLVTYFAGPMKFGIPPEFFDSPKIEFTYTDGNNESHPITLQVPQSNSERIEELWSMMAHSYEEIRRLEDEMVITEV